MDYIVWKPGASSAERSRGVVNPYYGVALIEAQAGGLLNTACVNKNKVR